MKYSVKQILKSLSLVAALACVPTAAPASENRAEFEINARDRKVVRDFLSGYVHELKSSFYVWNWFSPSPASTPWLGPLSASSPLGFERVSATSRRYWRGFCTKDASLNPADCEVPQMRASDTELRFGPGLYTAFDPVASAEFGGSPSWVLIQIKIPVGFRVFDMRMKELTRVPDEVRSALANYQCPTKWAKVAGLFEFPEASRAYWKTQLKPGPPDEHMGERCVLAIRQILKDDLKVDGVIYSYASTDFRECRFDGAENPLRQGALIIASANGITATDIRVFNSQTTAEMAERRRIQTMFYKASSPERDFSAAFTMSDQNAPASIPIELRVDRQKPQLLWSDLNGQTIDLDLKDWMRSNLPGCEGLSSSGH